MGTVPDSRRTEDVSEKRSAGFEGAIGMRQKVTAWACHSRIELEGTDAGAGTRPSAGLAQQGREEQSSQPEPQQARAAATLPEPSATGAEPERIPARLNNKTNKSVVVFFTTENT